MVEATTQKLWHVSMQNTDGNEVEFNIIAPERDTAVGLFSSCVVGTHLDRDEVAAAAGTKDAVSLVVRRIIDTGQTEEVLPSRIVFWEDTTREDVPLPVMDDPDPRIG